MKKYLLQLIFLLMPVMLFAQDRDSKAFKSGYAFGKIFFWIILAGIFVWLLARNLRKK